MNKHVLILFILATFLSCAEKEVKLPETSLNAITDILDVSPIYMFYNEEDGSVEFNRNNMISTTNWLVNIDKRLTLEQILPHLEYLQDKRNKASMHKNELAKNYLTCFNPETKSLSFIDFTTTEFYSNSALNHFKTNARETNYSNKIFVSIQDSSKVMINKDFEFIETTYDSFNKLLFNMVLKDDNLNTIYLSFHHKLSYQNYIAIKSQLLKTAFKNAQLAKEEFIYN